MKLYSTYKMEIKLKPVATVKNQRTTPTDDFWGSVISEIELCDHIPTEAFEGISDFSHLEIIYFFDKVEPGEIVFSGRPRGNPDYRIVGIFGQRKKDRPNTIGLSTVELLEHKGRKLTVKYLDAINGTPVLDIKPVFKEYQPKSEIRQPYWVSDLMKNYWE
jgi:tRNA (adenine37-N6)-methyltransferase